LAVPLFLNTLEQSSISTAIRESQSLFGFYFILTIHTVGLALLVGPNAMIDLRILGIASDIPIAPFEKWFKIMWIGFWLNAISGVLLLLAYPTKAFTNPVFYIKLTLIAFAVWIMHRIRVQVFGESSSAGAATLSRNRALAVWSLVLWTGAITAGRLLAYTFTYIVYGVHSS
jgi:hypothetical protein